MHNKNRKVREGSDIRLPWSGWRVIRCIAWRLGLYLRLGEERRVAYQ